MLKKLGRMDSFRFAFVTCSFFPSMFFIDGIICCLSNSSWSCYNLGYLGGMPFLELIKLWTDIYNLVLRSIVFCFFFLWTCNFSALLLCNLWTMNDHDTCYTFTETNYNNYIMFWLMIENVIYMVLYSLYACKI